MGREEGEIGNRLQLIEEVDSRSIQPIADFHQTGMSSTLRPIHIPVIPMTLAMNGNWLEE